MPFKILYFHRSKVQMHAEYCCCCPTFFAAKNLVEKFLFVNVRTILTENLCDKIKRQHEMEMKYTATAIIWNPFALLIIFQHANGFCTNISACVTLFVIYNNNNHDDDDDDDNTRI